MSVSLLLILALIVLVLLWRTTSRRAVEHVSCARCLYAVEFAPAQHCPECGSDLTHVGVLTPGMGRTNRRPWRTVMALAISVYPALIAGGIVGMVVAVLLPPASVTERSQQIPQPVSGAYRSVEVSISSRRRGDVVRIGNLCLRIEHNDGTWSRRKCFRPSNDTFFRHFEVERTGDRVVKTLYLAPSRDAPRGPYPFFEPSDVPVEELIAWAGAIGLDADDPQIRNELHDIIRVATRGFYSDGSTTFTLRHFQGTTVVHMSSRSEDSLIPYMVTLGVAALVWLLYALSMRRRVRREREAWRAAAALWLAKH